ncbi:hypothetical protein IFVP203_C2190216 [Vibrio parahaemolyticus]
MAHVKNNHIFYMEKEDGRENEQCNLKINDVFPLGYRAWNDCGTHFWSSHG